jgi:hypothetical protein
VAVLPGDGAGGLGAATGPVAVGQPDDVDFPAGVAVADVDEDGALDVVGTNNGTEGDLWAVPGDGSGGLTAPSWAPVSAGTDLGIGDIDGDGHLDAVVAKPGTAGAEVLYGDGDGRFGDPHPVGGASGARGLSVVVARLDAGPTVDVAVGRGQGTPQLTDVFLNTLEGRDH